jgi:hypothetical protein
VADTHAAPASLSEAKELARRRMLEAQARPEDDETQADTPDTPDDDTPDDDEDDTAADAGSDEDPDDEDGDEPDDDEADDDEADDEAGVIGEVMDALVGAVLEVLEG